MRILKWLIGGLLALAALFVVVGFLLPDHVHVERAIVIERSPAHVHAILDGYERFNEWSPWAEMDPNATYTYTGPKRGVGARLAWSGDPATVGTGSQEITASVPDQRVETALDFGEHGKATAAFVLTPENGGTRVVWGFDTHFDGNLVGRWFGLLMERMLAPDYERGLVRLKALVESLPPEDITGLDPSEIDHPALTLLLASAEMPVADLAVVSARLGALYAEINAAMNANALQQTGVPLTITSAYDDGVWKFDAAIPVDRNDVALDGEVRAGTSPSGKAMRFVHVGPYTGLAAFHARVRAWLEVHGMRVRDRVMEQYVSDPATMPEADLVTHLIYPVE
jgi:effector-binding domain-containing protein